MDGRGGLDISGFPLAIASIVDVMDTTVNNEDQAITAAVVG